MFQVICQTDLAGTAGGVAGMADPAGTGPGPGPGPGPGLGESEFPVFGAWTKKSARF